MGEHCEAVELLLARMDSNPEEFEEGGRWEKLIVKYRTYLPVQDRTAMEDKINALRLDTFHKDVMSKLLAETREDVERVVYTGATTIPLTTGVAYANAIASPSVPINLSQQSIKEIASALGVYANVWRP
jgi:hypothetical protein